MTEDSLNLRVERAWCALQEIHSKRVLYLTPGYALRWLAPGQPAPEGSHLVGEFNWTVGLLQLREHVFAVYERTWRASHGHAHR